MPSGVRAAFSLWEGGREKSVSAEDSMDWRREMGTPWLMTWNAPHERNALPMRVAALGRERSINGTESELESRMEL